MSSLRNEDYMLTGEEDDEEFIPSKRSTKRNYYIAGFFVVASAVLIGLFFGGVFDMDSSSNNTPNGPNPSDVARAILEANPLIDGHNDLPWQYRQQFNDSVWTDMDLRDNQSDILQTDIPRLRMGQVGGQFWSVYMDCSTQYSDAVRTTMEQIDVVYKMIQRYPLDFELALTASDVQRIFNNGKIASLIGIEGGHSIDSSLGALRQFYKLGVRYMTLTHNCNTPWADSCVGPNEYNGLTQFGEDIIREMNRLGMLVDLSHVSADTMHAVLDIARSPVYFSHSSVYSICNVTRNVPDDVLARLPANGGVVSITFVPSFLRCDGQPAYVSDVADHIDYIKNYIGVDYIALGGDYDGVDDLPIGLEDVSKYPNLITELVTRGYTDAEIIAIIGGNTLRVLQANEDMAASLQANETPYESVIFPSVPCRGGPPGTSVTVNNQKEEQDGESV